jgi:hypothetical protein
MDQDRRHILSHYWQKSVLSQDLSHILTQFRTTIFPLPIAKLAYAYGHYSKKHGSTWVRT